MSTQDQLAKAMTRGMVEKFHAELTKQGMDEQAKQLQEIATRRLSGSAELAQRYEAALREIGKIVGMDTQEPSFDPFEVVHAVRARLQP